jgi:hypothetical protein
MELHLTEGEARVAYEVREAQTVTIREPEVEIVCLSNEYSIRP